MTSDLGYTHACYLKPVTLSAEMTSDLGYTHACYLKPVTTI